MNRTSILLGLCMTLWACPSQLDAKNPSDGGAAGGGAAVDGGHDVDGGSGPDGGAGTDGGPTVYPDGGQAPSSVAPAR